MEPGQRCSVNHRQVVGRHDEWRRATVRSVAAELPKQVESPAKLTVKPPESMPAGTPARRKPARLAVPLVSVVAVPTNVPLIKKRRTSLASG